MTKKNDPSPGRERAEGSVGWGDSELMLLSDVGIPEWELVGQNSALAS